MQASTGRRAAEEASTTPAPAGAAERHGGGHRGHDLGEDLEAAHREFDRVAAAMDDWAERRAGGRHTEATSEWVDLSLAHEDAKVELVDEAYMAVARAVGEYLVLEGKTETWRCLFLLLFCRFDFSRGREHGYALGDELAFLDKTGYWADDWADHSPAAGAERVAP
jgi:hypothetical protein